MSSKNHHASGVVEFHFNYYDLNKDGVSYRVFCDGCEVTGHADTLKEAMEKVMGILDIYPESS